MLFWINRYQILDSLKKCICDSKQHPSDILKSLIVYQRLDVGPDALEKFSKVIDTSNRVAEQHGSLLVLWQSTQFTQDIIRQEVHWSRTIYLAESPWAGQVHRLSP
ncbi:uncharacterized protein LOC112495380 [Cephus cinctus]|uniref:Uncharacterized protein LOC112495380 n=1 Tax=Cephus cinctus TaxID=211228 RepID=A0AAJ7RVT5_CEPCN|nr:uncharacterized protein LOC112495380 [Cephus cinctus]